MPEREGGKLVRSTAAVKPTFGREQNPNLITRELAAAATSVGEKMFQGNHRSLQERHQIPTGFEGPRVEGSPTEVNLNLVLREEPKIE